MQSNVIIRCADCFDSELLAELGARTFSETFAAENSAEDMASYLSSAFIPAQMAAELADAGASFFVAEVEGEAAGYAKLSEGEPRACVKGDRPVELARIYVLEKWLGKSVGQALMERCMDEARRAGFRTIWLGVWQRNERAQAFYRKWGFRIVGEQVFQLGADEQTDWVMECAL
jgi:ribosomal protein S18 acetylase RimI-like enzyme